MNHCSKVLNRYKYSLHAYNAAEPPKSMHAFGAVLILIRFLGTSNKCGFCFLFFSPNVGGKGNACEKTLRRHMLAHASPTSCLDTEESRSKMGTRQRAFFSFRANGLAPEHRKGVYRCTCLSHHPQKSWPLIGFFSPIISYWGEMFLGILVWWVHRIKKKKTQGTLY